jgi:putative nucleotidyltransferase with HDIG domain
MRQGHDVLHPIAGRCAAGDAGQAGGGVIRVLFVDDEPNVLHAMRRSLHCMRNEWVMEFVLGGVEALESLEAMAADVIVTDMRMPGMDGWQLLTEVKKRHPQTVRLILSGHAEATSIMRAVGIAHQYLAKPCEAAAVKLAISQTQKLRHLVQSDHLAALVGRVGMLPSEPRAFQELVQCLQEPSASLGDAARIIGRDVAMTANIMKIVNSAFFGARQPIVSTSRAVAYLGLDTLGALVLGHSVFKTDGKPAQAGFTSERLWTHSLQTAMAARVIAQCEAMPPPDVEKVFLAGFLHDVGKIVLAAGSASEMREHHAAVGAYLLALWGFPNPIVEAVAYHHVPSQASGGALGLTGVVHAADYLMHERETRLIGAIEPVLEEGFLESLGLSNRLEKWRSALNNVTQEQAAQ